MSKCNHEVCGDCLFYLDSGHCEIDYEETEATWLSCDGFFICSVCKQEILTFWSCL